MTRRLSLTRSRMEKAREQAVRDVNEQLGGRWVALLGRSGAYRVLVERRVAELERER